MVSTPRKKKARLIQTEPVDKHFALTYQESQVATAPLAVPPKHQHARSNGTLLGEASDVDEEIGEFEAVVSKIPQNVAHEGQRVRRRASQTHAIDQSKTSTKVPRKDSIQLQQMCSAPRGRKNIERTQREQIDLCRKGHRHKLGRARRGRNASCCLVLLLKTRTKEMLDVARDDPKTRPHKDQNKARSSSMKFGHKSMNFGHKP